MVINEADSVITLKIDGIEIPAWVYGIRENPIILFIHGFPRPFSELYGDLPMKYLKDKYCCVGFDLPGFGQSLNLSISPQEFLEAVKQATSPNRPIVLFGISYGGLVALDFASHHNDQVYGVIMAGTPVFNKPFLLGTRAAVKLPNWLLLRLIGIFLRQADDLQKIMRAVLTGNASKVLHDFTFLTGKELQNISAPVLLLYGDKDTVGTLDMGKKLSSRLQNAVIATNSDRSHSWLLHRIDQTGFLDAINQFLSKVCKS